MARICELPGCNKTLEGRRSQAKYCCDQHKIEAFKRNKQKKETYGLGSTPMSQLQQNGFNMNPSSANEFLLQQRITELLAEKRELIADNKELAKKNESLRDELAALKTDHAIFKVENEKPEGGALNGIIGALKESPEMLPQIIQSIPALLQGLSAMGKGGGAPALPQVADPQVQAQLTDFMAWYASLPPDIRTQVWNMIEKISNMEPENQKFHISNFLNNLPDGTRKTGTN